MDGPHGHEAFFSEIIGYKIGDRVYDPADVTIIRREARLSDGSRCPDCGTRLLYRHGSGVNLPPGLTCFGCGWNQDHFGDAAVVTRGQAGP